jgi:GT2 family glycosyltransferase
MGSATTPGAVTLIVVTHNSAAHIEASLGALTTDEAGPSEIIVIDNASSDASLEIIERFGVKCIPLTENVGFPAACNLGAEKASHDIVAFLNPDTEPTPGWLAPLVEALQQEGVAAAMPVLELTYKPGHYFTSGSALTYLGFAWSTDTGTPIPDDLATREVPFPSGAAFAMRKALFERLGGLRAEYFLYLEDVDLGWRIRLMGMRTLQVPAARVAHDYDFERHPDKMYYLERNRLRMVYANYRKSTLLLLAPAFVAAEMGVVAASLKYGWFGDKARSWLDVWRLRKLLFQEVERSRDLRVVGDDVILRDMDAAFEGINQMPLSPAMHYVNKLIVTYLRVVRLIVRGS